jgi:hypothetical protein
VLGRKRYRLRRHKRSVMLDGTYSRLDRAVAQI